MSINMSFNTLGMKIISLNIMVHNFIIQKCEEIQNFSQNQVVFIMKWTLGRDANANVVNYAGMKAIVVTNVLTNPASRGRVRINDNACK